MCVSLFLFAELCGLWQMVIMLKHEQLKHLLFNILLAINALARCSFPLQYTVEIHSKQSGAALVTLR